MKLSRAGVLLAFGPPTIAILGYVFQAPWVFLGVTVGWLLTLQILDSVAGHERAVPWSALRNEIRPPSSRFPTEDVILYVYVLVHLAAVGLGVWQMSRTDDVLPWMLFAFPVRALRCDPAHRRPRAPPREHPTRPVVRPRRGRGDVLGGARVRAPVPASS